MGDHDHAGSARRGGVEGGYVAIVVDGLHDGRAALLGLDRVGVVASHCTASGTGTTGWFSTSFLKINLFSACPGDNLAPTPKHTHQELCISNPITPLRRCHYRHARLR